MMAQNPPKERYGKVKVSTIYRDFNAMREAVQSGDWQRIDDAWGKCERWLGFIYERNAT